jgi:CRISPR system Cascade subunit CasB
MWNVMGSVLNDSESTEEQRRIKDWEFQRVADAVHYALALCATHQQSRSVPAHVTGQSLGAAARRLGQRMNSADGAATRFRAAATADTLEELVGHLRGLVPLLRSKDVRLDYVNLARAMAAWPDPFRRARFVKRWGMDFYRSPAAPASAGADTPEE